MNMTEANDTNTLLRWLLGIRRPAEIEIDDQELADAAEEAAARLAGRAYLSLSAGVTEDKVRGTWERVEACPWQDAPPVDEYRAGDRIECTLLPGFVMTVQAVDTCETPECVSLRITDPAGEQDWLCSRDVRQVSR